MGQKDCKACNGTGQQKGTDGIIIPCPVCCKEETIVDLIKGVGNTLFWIWLIIGICLLIFYLLD